MSAKEVSIEEQQQWDFEIKPNKSLFNLHLDDVWRYRDLLFLLVRRDFVSFYKQTILGPVWFFLQPIFTVAIFTVVFGRLAGISTEGVPPLLFYLAGTVAWNYFSECLTKTSTVFKDNANIFGKVYFPRLIMPLSIILSNLVKFFVQFALFVLMLLWFLFQGKSVHPNAFIFLFPVIILLMAIQGLGFGLIVTALTNKYRDLAFLVTFGVQLMMYATPIIYPLSSIHNPVYRKYLTFNPLTGLIETFRYGFLGGGQFYSAAFVYSCIVSIVVFLLGVIIFNKVEKDFVDTV